MKVFFAVISAIALLNASALHAAPLLFTGEIAVLRASGQQCAPEIFEGLPQIDLVLDRQADGNYRGYLSLQNVKIGKLSGSDLSRLSVTYPYFDPALSTGHALSLDLGKEIVAGTLQEKGIGKTAEGCAIEVGEIRLSAVPDEDANLWMQHIEKSYQALALSSEALSLVKQGAFAKAITLYQKALSLEEAAQGPGSPLVLLYLDALAQTYAKNNQPQQGIALLEPRLEGLGDLETRFLSESLAQLLNLQGALLYRDRKYPEALPVFRRAMALDPAVSAYPAGVARTLIMLKRPGDAAVFLDQVAPQFPEPAAQKEFEQIRKELRDQQGAAKPSG